MVRRLTLAPVERETLVQAVKHHAKAYVRERAAALLKIAGGASAAWVAGHGLLTEHAPDVVYGWLNRYEAEGLAALTIRPGRGRKPTLPPPGARRAGRAPGRVAGSAWERSA
jgi:transposase